MDEPRRPGHLCASCTKQRPDKPIPCSVNAPAASQAVRGETVTACSSYRGRDGRTIFQERHDGDA